ncbi:hypothetical protein KM043_006845 [Ampulex compressa]|nr:hypothetical protein KM043_006845 [Ampulex compressa]
MICGSLFIIATLFAVSIAKDYCKMQSCVEYGLMHTMCKYSNSIPAERCGPKEFIITGLREDQRRRILQVHNNLRARVAAGKETRGAPGPQPPASNIAPLTWDPELEMIAQRWANQCTFSTIRVGHDDCRNVEQYYVGQNVGYKSSSGKNTFKAVDIVREWYNEVQYFDAGLVPKVTNYGKSGHYTQLVSADAKTVGCGLIRYKEEDGWNALYVVCNYGPGGNAKNGELYKIRR